MSYKWHSIKQRSFDAQPVQFSAGKIISPPNGGNRFDPSSIVAKGKQITASFRHRRFPDGKYHSGGPFYTAYNKPGTPTRNVKIKDRLHNPPWYEYQGNVVQPLNFGDSYGFSSYLYNQDDSHLDKYGAEAIAIVDPTNPNANTGVALGELILDRKISLPVLQAWKRRTEIAKAAGSEYLSAQFGWLPLINDIQNTVQSIRDATTIMNNYESLDGQEVHREFEFEPIITDDVKQVGTNLHCIYTNTGSNVPGFASQTGSEQSRHTKSTTRRWFSGTFIHYPQKVSPLAERFGVGSEADKLFGITLTPDVLWDLAPWSWAIDWFSNTQEVLTNLTNFEISGLIMKYGFIMEEKSTTETLFMPSTGLSGVSGPPPNIVNASCVKRRKEANPFGFGVGWEGLSPTQLAITAALGITRLL